MAAFFGWILLLLGSAPAAYGVEPGPATKPAEAPSEPIPAKSDIETFNVHAQATVISQKHDAFDAPYSGLHSLRRIEPWRTSVTATLFMGARLPWPGGEIYFDPEVAGGEGFSGVFGIAAFPNGEIPRVGSPEPEPYVARLYLRQTFGLGGERERVESDQNQLAGYRDVSRLSVYVGRFSAADFFDNNAYSHDPRTQFENWALMDNGAWDYPADTRGYTYGLVFEWNQPNGALRYGAFDMPKVANGGTFDWNVPKALGQAVELEARWTAGGGHVGVARGLAYLNSAHMGVYRRAIEFPGPGGPDITLARTYDIKYGFGLSVQQEITADVGIFGRVGWNDGHTESFAFTEIDRTASLGLSIKGTRWHRPEDVVGLAGVIDGLARDHRDYLGAGGYGFIIGDGRLPHYAPEQVVEAYYLFKVADHVFVTPDVQYVVHPAYNPDRGPVFVGGIRAHVEF